MKRILLIFVLIILNGSLWAAWLNNVSVNIRQADGTEMKLFASGDEFYNWVHDEEGYTIVMNEDGFLVYALLENDELVPSQYRVGQVNPKDLGLKPWLNVSSQKMLETRTSFLAYTSQMEKQAGYQKSEQDAEGSINNLVVYIRFADQNEFVIDTSLYLDMFNKDEADYNSMYNYFQKN